MDGSVNPSEVATLSLLGRGGYGGYNNGYGGDGNFRQDGSAIKASLDARTASDAIQAVNTHSAINGLSDQINNSNASLRDKMDTANLNRLMADASADRAAKAAAAEKCCCEALINAAKLEAKMDAVLAGQARSDSRLDHDQLHDGQHLLQTQINELRFGGGHG